MTEDHLGVQRDHEEVDQPRNPQETAKVPDQEDKDLERNHTPDQGARGQADPRDEDSPVQVPKDAEDQEVEEIIAGLRLPHVRREDRLRLHLAERTERYAINGRRRENVPLEVSVNIYTLSQADLTKTKRKPLLRNKKLTLIKSRKIYG